MDQNAVQRHSSHCLLGQRTSPTGYTKDTHLASTQQGQAHGAVLPALQQLVALAVQVDVHHFAHAAHRAAVDLAHAVAHVEACRMKVQSMRIGNPITTLRSAHEFQCDPECVEYD
jgi:hypothetical protein